MSSSELMAGARVLGGRYRLVRPLGEGGMGVVWEVEDASSRARYAIKFVKDEVRSEKAARRLRREAEATNAIAHPNIIRIVDVVEEDDGGAAIIMELLEGESLGERLVREGSQAVGQTCAILMRVASALRAAHAAGIVHRDLKPDNIFLVRGPDGSVDVRVLDFGIAKRLELPTDSLTVTGTIMGTPMYMSPEQAGGERGIDPRTDVWSLAVLAFECLTGTTPATADNYGQLLTKLIKGEISHLADVQPMLPPDLLAAVDGALVPRDRRSPDLAPTEAVFARYADRAIAAVAPRSVVSDPASVSGAASGPSVPRAAASNDALLATQAADPTPRRRSVAVVALVAGAIVLVAVVGVGVAAVALRGRPTSGTPSAQPSGAAEVTAAQQPEPSASAAAGEPLSVATGAAGVAAAQPSTSSTRPSHPPRTSASSKTPATAGAGAGVPATAGSGPNRLQGGVAGDVPF
jgi:eukaryotic-like serine/threonine-protein kinase